MRALPGVSWLVFAADITRVALLALVLVLRGVITVRVRLLLLVRHDESAPLRADVQATAAV